jgi:hypothetical protein
MDQPDQVLDPADSADSADPTALSGEAVAAYASGEVDLDEDDRPWAEPGENKREKYLRYAENAARAIRSPGGYIVGTLIGSIIYVFSDTIKMLFSAEYRQQKQILRENRIEILTEAIERDPEAAVNYVLRGEAFLQKNAENEAAADFNRALELAERQAEDADWGYIDRAVADRAREGLRRVEGS